MGYLVSKRRRSRGGQPVSLGDLASVIAAAEKTVGTAIDIAQDPYLPETLCHVAQLKQIKAKAKVSSCPPTRRGLPGGIGLDRLQLPLRAYVYAQQRPWVFPVAGALVVALPFMLGYAVAKGKI